MRRREHAGGAWWDYGGGGRALARRVGPEHYQPVVARRGPEARPLPRPLPRGAALVPCVETEDDTRALGAAKDGRRALTFSESRPPCAACGGRRDPDWLCPACLEGVVRRRVAAVRGLKALVGEATRAQLALVLPAAARD